MQIVRESEMEILRTRQMTLRGAPLFSVSTDRTETAFPFAQIFVL